MRGNADRRSRRQDAGERHEREREIERDAVADGRRCRPKGQEAFDVIVTVVFYGGLIWWLFF